MTEPERVVLIERTSKRLKGMRALGCAGAIFGLVIGISGATVFGSTVMWLGLLLYVVARVGAWWKHG